MTIFIFCQRSQSNNHKEDEDVFFTTVMGKVSNNSDYVDGSTCTSQL